MGEMVDGRSLRGGNTPLFVVVWYGSLGRLLAPLDFAMPFCYNITVERKEKTTLTLKQRGKHHEREH